MESASFGSLLALTNTSKRAPRGLLTNVQNPSLLSDSWATHSLQVVSNEDLIPLPPELFCLDAVGFG
jgi:hypothetical protein